MWLRHKFLLELFKNARFPQQKKRRKLKLKVITRLPDYTQSHYYLSTETVLILLLILLQSIMLGDLHDSIMQVMLPDRSCVTMAAENKHDGDDMSAEKKD